MRFCLALVLAAASYAQPAANPPILDYINHSWDTLTRSNRMLDKAAPDPKFHRAADGRWPVYISVNENLVRITAGLRRALSPAAFKTIEIRRLPAGGKPVTDQGLLYLPHPYVVPGGRFNEMYGWDSYFIQVGLLRDGRIDLAKDMADNFLYEIRNYGKILNANRTYYMTRSQPPFLTQMVLGVYRKTHDKKWLIAAIPAIEKCYQLWSTAPHLTPETGLSRYYDFGEGPAPEVIASEKDAQGRTHYDLIRDFYRTHEVSAYEVGEYYDKSRDILTSLFYKGDRSMRESGFDPSDRFGPFNVDIIHYDPVCLNSLLYLMEMQTAEILKEAGRPAEAPAWEQRAKTRAGLINKLMWSDKDGLYYDYNFVHKRQRQYPFLTTFYPLWAGIATPEQAERVRANLPEFERPGGLLTSTTPSGNQWDSPFGWAPLEMIAVEGLRRYHFDADAERVSVKFLSLIAEQYARSGTIVEKYDVVKRSSRVSGDIHFGYSSNEIGFGWTNAAFTTLYDALTPEDQHAILAAK